MSPLVAGFLLGFGCCVLGYAVGFWIGRWQPRRITKWSDEQVEEAIRISQTPIPPLEREP